jgi:hypothetical protein
LLAGRRCLGGPCDLGSILGSDDYPDDHQQQRRDLAGDRHGAAAHSHVQPHDSEGDRQDRVGCGDDGLDGGEERALLEGVLVEQVADRADYEKNVDRPVAEQPAKAVAEI